MHGFGRSMVNRVVAAGLMLTACLAADEEVERETSLSLGVNITAGDNDTVTLSAGLRSEMSSDTHDWLFSVDGNYGETETETDVNGATVSERETTTQNGKGAVKYKRKFGRRYGYSDNSMLHDDIAGIDYRLIVGVGAGYSLVQRAAVTVGIEAGGAYIKEQLADDDNADYPAIRIALTHEQRLGETVKVWDSVEYLPTADDMDDYLVNAEIGIEAAVNHHMHIRLVARDRYDSTPPAESEKNNLQVIGAMVFTL